MLGVVPEPVLVSPLCLLRRRCERERDVEAWHFHLLRSEALWWCLVGLARCRARCDRSWHWQQPAAQGVSLCVCGSVCSGLCVCKGDERWLRRCSRLTQDRLSRFARSSGSSDGAGRGEVREVRLLCLLLCARLLVVRVGGCGRGVVAHAEK
ncbi:hypothetical protein FGO68_gene378 [Halteria grandinella]|uniref:Uncharacterized protein n=1 Tax=Halteria grandinella TaxID=5974 RepID=A0A8J8NJV7_HALGN|nr:hypothetical protein FGO68_gene378 [Halteria grandinella]